MLWNPLYHTAGDIFMDNLVLFKNNARVELQATEEPSRAQVILCSSQSMLHTFQPVIMAVQRVLDCWTGHQEHLTDNTASHQTWVWLLFAQHLPDVL